MKKIYVLIISGFLASQVMAQSATVTTSDKSANKQTNVASSVATQQTTNATTTTLSDLPGFPALVNTGNADLDNANYKAAKDNWIKNNQAAYDAFVGNSNETTVVGYEAVDLPGFPKYINTGNVSADKVTYLNAKNKWVSENQEIYNNYLNEKGNSQNNTKK